jgi:hypothetical protein
MPPNNETKLAQAARHVAEGNRIVAEQRAVVARQQSRGLNTAEAEMLLSQFERTQAIFEADLKAAQDGQAAGANTAT